MPANLTPIVTEELCSLGCEHQAKFKSKSNKLYCEYSPNRCPVNKTKNSKGLQKAHAEGRVLGWTQLNVHEQRRGKFNFELYDDVSENDIFKYNGKGSHKKILISQRGHCCESCNNTEWLDQPITLELEHIDGDKSNNTKINLKLLCPNCHSQTPTWKRKKHSHNGKLKFDKEVYINAINSSENVNQVCSKLHLGAHPNTYNTIYRIMIEHNLKFKVTNV